MPHLLARLFLIFAMLSGPCFAKPDPQILVGKEVEVFAEELRYLFPYFDLAGARAALPSIPRSYFDSLGTSGHQSNPTFDKQIADFLLKDTEKPPKLRADCPMEIRKLLETMEWEQHDNRYIEFRDKVPFSDEDKYIAHTNAFIRLIHREEVMNNPEKHLGKTHYHMHISILNRRDKTAVLRTLNDLRLLMFLENGRADYAFGYKYGYKENIKTKGLLRQLFDGKGDFEIRKHFGSVEEELKYIRRLFSIPEKKALNELRREIDSKLTSPAIKEILMQDPQLLIRFLKRNKIQQKDYKLRIAAAVKEIFKDESAQLKAGWYDFLKSSATRRSPEGKLHKLFRETIISEAEKSPEGLFRRRPESYLKMLTMLKFDVAQARWSNFLESIVRNEEEQSTRLAAMVTLFRMSEKNAHARSAVLNLLGDPQNADAVLARIDASALQDADIRRRVFEILPKASESSRESFFIGLRIETRPVPERDRFIAWGVEAGDANASLLAKGVFSANEDIRRKCIQLTRQVIEEKEQF